MMLCQMVSYTPLCIGSNPAQVCSCLMPCQNSRGLSPAMVSQGKAERPACLAIGHATGCLPAMLHISPAMIASIGLPTVLPNFVLTWMTCV